MQKCDIIQHEVIIVWSTIQCDIIIQCDTIQCDTMQSDRIQCNKIQCDKIQCDTIHVHYDTIQCDNYNTV